MMTDPKTPIEPPHDPVPYEIAIAGSIWGGPHYLCTDEEAYQISRVPERSLRNLQRVGYVNATKLSRQHGGMIRTWHIAEVGAAAVCEVYKRAIGQDYADAATNLLPAARAIKRLFASFHGFAYASELGDWRPYWRATLNFVDDRFVYLSASQLIYEQHHIGPLESLRIDLDRPGDPSRVGLRETTRHHYFLAVRDDDNGDMRELTEKEINKSLVSELDHGRIEAVLNLHNIFTDVETAVKKVQKLRR